MSERKKEVIELLKKKGVDPIRLEREIMTLLRKRYSTVEVSSYIRKLVEGEKNE